MGLVCEDKTRFKAHKFVLIACSPVFQSIIDDLTQSEGSVVYLRGVYAQEVKSILHFMYLGQATLYQDRMNEFLNVAKSLEIKEISKDVECDFEAQENMEYIHSNHMNIIDSKAKESQRRDLEELNCKQKQNISSYQNERGQYECSRCEKEFVHKKSLFHHEKSVHEGINYPCNKCNKAFTSNRDLSRHIQSIHEGVKYQCDLCDAVFNHKNHLQSH